MHKVRRVYSRRKAKIPRNLTDGGQTIQKRHWRSVLPCWAPQIVHGAEASSLEFRVRVNEGRTTVWPRCPEIDSTPFSRRLWRSVENLDSIFQPNPSSSASPCANNCGAAGPEWLGSCSVACVVGFASKLETIELRCRHIQINFPRLSPSPLQDRAAPRGLSVLRDLNPTAPLTQSGCLSIQIASSPGASEQSGG